MPTQATKSIRENNFPTLKKKVGFVPSPQSWRENNYSRPPPLKKVLWLSIKFLTKSHLVCWKPSPKRNPILAVILWVEEQYWRVFSKLDVITRGTWPEIKTQHLSLTGWGALFSNGLSGIWLGKSLQYWTIKPGISAFLKKFLKTNQIRQK